MRKSKVASYSRLLLSGAALAAVISVGVPSARAGETKAAAALSDVEKTVAIEEIRQLKFRWWVNVDNQNWDEVRALFVSPDAKIEIDMKAPDGTPITTAKQFVDFTAGHFYTGQWKGIHLGQNALFTFKSAKEAEATWIFEAVQWPEVDGKPSRSAERHVWGHHFDTYIKTANGWRIASTRFETTTSTRYEPVTKTSGGAR